MGSKRFRSTNGFASFFLLAGVLLGAGGCEGAASSALGSGTAKAAAGPSGPVATEADLRALPAFRFNNVHLVPPAGWNKALSSKSRYIFEHPSRLRGADNPNIERLTIEVTVALKVDGNLQSIVEGDTEFFIEKNKGYTLDEPVKEGRTKQGYRTLTHVCSANSDMQAWKRYYYLIVHLDGGEYSQSFTLLTTRPDWRDKWRKTVEELADSAYLPSAVKLADGPAGSKSLSLYDSYQMADFLEWLLELPFTEAQRQHIQDYLVDTWKRGAKDEMDGVEQVFKFRRELDQLDEKKREVGRQLARQEAIKEWRAEAAKGDKAAKWILDLYDGANKPLASGKDGETPLTMQAADATLEILYFMASKADGQKSETRPNAGRTAAWEKQLAEVYPTMSADQKQEIAQMPVMWAALRAAWGELPEDQRQAAAKEWAQAPAVKVLIEQFKQEREAQAAGFKAAQRYSEYQQVKWMTAGMMERTHQLRMQSIRNMSGYSYRY